MKTTAEFIIHHSSLITLNSSLFAYPLALHGTTLMSSPDLVGLQREMLRDLLRASAERAREEPGATTLFRAEVEQTEHEYAAGVAAAARRLTGDEEDAERELAGLRRALEGRFERQQQAAVVTTAGER